MQIIIFEGISTSGKTTLISRLYHLLEKNGQKVQMISEDDTLMPIINNNDLDVAKKFLFDFLEWTVSKEIDFLLIDRFHFTHVFRTNSTLEDFSDFEEQLAKDATIILLKVKEDTIQERLEDALKTRDDLWRSYFRTKGTMEEAVSYYIAQQKKLVDLVKNTKLKTLTLDVSTQSSEESFNQIVETLNLNKKDL